MLGLHFERRKQEKHFCFSCIVCMKIDILLIGCGGTGGCFFTKMVRFLTDTKLQNMNLSFRIMDGDHVEAKNLGRQPFLEEDIGRNKAVALASAAEEVLDVKVKAYPQYLTPDNKYILNKDIFFESKSSSGQDIKMIVGAVDNHACRKILHEYFLDYNSLPWLFYIDAANEMSCGEIVIGKKKSGKIETPDRVHYYPEILTDTGKAAYEMSCEELNNAAPQHLATNSLAADLLFSYIAQVISAGSFASKAPGGIIYFDAFKLFSRFDEYKENLHGKIKY